MLPLTAETAKQKGTKIFFQALKLKFHTQQSSVVRRQSRTETNQLARCWMKPGRVSTHMCASMYVCVCVYKHNVHCGNHGDYGGQITIAIFNSILKLESYEMPLPNLHHVFQHRHILSLQSILNSKHHDIQLLDNHGQTWRNTDTQRPGVVNFQFYCHLLDLLKASLSSLLLDTKS